MVTTGDGELGFDSGEGAWETATTSKEGSRRANYPMLIRRGSDKKYQCRTQRVLRLEWVQFKNLNEEQLEGKSGASSRGNSAPIVYIKVAAVKKLVVGLRSGV